MHLLYLINSHPHFLCTGERRGKDVGELRAYHSDSLHGAAVRSSYQHALSKYPEMKEIAKQLEALWCQFFFDPFLAVHPWHEHEFSRVFDLGLWITHKVGVSLLSAFVFCLFGIPEVFLDLFLDLGIIKQIQISKVIVQFLMINQTGQTHSPLTTDHHKLYIRTFFHRKAVIHRNLPKFEGT